MRKRILQAFFRLMPYFEPTTYVNRKSPKFEAVMN